MGQLQPRRDRRDAADLAGKYRLIAELGQGGMATVYLAVAMGNSGFRKLAVVKLLRPEFAVDEEFIQMFLDEARLCARLSHPNIVHTYDVGVDESGHLIAMEYLDGVSMHAATSKLGRNGGPFTFPLQAKALLEVIEGLRYAHELKDYDGTSLQIVHRDVTPHNIFVTYDGQVKLLDFGIAKAATSSVKTATGVIKGKLTYMAPEQARGDHVDARADLYACGVMLWEAATGRRRWPAGLTEPALFTRLATGELPESPNVAAKGYPEEIDAIIMRSLAPDPAERFQTAAEMRDALAAALRKMEPVAMRDFGLVLSETFAEDRRKIRGVIEEQFRAIDEGNGAPEPHQLPAVPHPSFITATDSMERNSPQPGAGRVIVDIDADSLAESHSRRITAPAPDPKETALGSRRTQLALVGAGALMAGAFALGLAIQRGHSTSPLPAPSAATAVASVDPSATASARRTPEPPANAEATNAAPDDIAAPSASETASARHPEATARRVAQPVPSAHAAPSATASAAPVATPAPSDTSTESVPLRTPNGRPKVQLERDNPWP
jgi:serine/threonine protein kinase